MTDFESREDYLESILVIKNEKGSVRSIDIAEHLHYSKPSVSIAMKKLKDLNYITIDENGFIVLTPSGYEIAAETYDKHVVLSNMLCMLGVPEDIAKKDACEIEHDLSKESFECIKKHLATYTKTLKK